MDLWIICQVGTKKTLTKGQEYQVVDIDPLNGLIRVINDNDNLCWFNEKCFKRNEELINMETKKNYKPFICDFNVSGNCVGFKVICYDTRLPYNKSLGEFLDIELPYDIEIEIKNENGSLCVSIEERGDRHSNGIYPTNAETLEFAYKARMAMDYLNAVLMETPIQEEKMEVYQIKFNPAGTVYTFRSNDKLSKGEAVVCKSSLGYDFGLIVGIVQEPKSEWETRAYCSKIKML